MRLAFVTPVWKRHELTTVCLAQRRRMIDFLAEHGIEAECFVVGDEPILSALSEELGLHWVEQDNEFIGRKFNAGYAAAIDAGFDYAMAIGSDSWLDATQLVDAPLGPDVCVAMVGLSSFKQDGLERRDLFVKYAAGFGVGMVYPLAALGREPCQPDKMKGCDTSVWRRTGQGKLKVKFLPLDKLSYLNFTSDDVQITKYEALDFHRRNTLLERREDRIFGDLRSRYDDDLVDAVEGLYAARSIGKFLTGRTVREDRLARAAERKRKTDDRRRRRGLPARGQGARR